MDLVWSSIILAQEDVHNTISHNKIRHRSPADPYSATFKWPQPLNWSIEVYLQVFTCLSPSASKHILQKQAHFLREDSRSQEWISINILKSQSSLIEPKILMYSHSIKQHCRYCVQRRMELTRPGKVRKPQCIQVRKRWLLWEPKRNDQQLLRLPGGVCFSHEVCYYCYCFRAQLHTMIAVSVTFLKP